MLQSFDGMSYNLQWPRLQKYRARVRAPIPLFTSSSGHAQLRGGTPCLPVHLGQDANFDVATMSSFFAAHGLGLSRLGEAGLGGTVSEDSG